MYGLILSLLVFVLLVLVFIISKKSLLDREKASPFECGFDPVVSSRLPFSLRFFLIALIFLIFDVEVVLIFPFVYSVSWVAYGGWVSLAIVFLLILLLGLFYEWNYGALEWCL
uniref:NADH-ubiquinone oxidoreductase chain 3 n=1 Tax=Limnadia lenticularis TaxID=84336 RepID=A0A3G1RRX1_9CRUS|nr:NADH dehydrogenase subunit 3 [Limnadia lenticularis]AXH81654.1 NADH dehydrogenase subunit 3 [Limnadia lenticularis]